MDGANEQTRFMLIAAGSVLIVLLFLSRSIFLFIPAFAVVIYLLWKRGGGRRPVWEEDDPADWWKKDRQSGESS